ncbi:MAG: hypothetical protein WC511_02455 [Candidatus Pacearchaeota archaeon]
MKKMIIWVVTGINAEGNTFLYSASNAETKRVAIQIHLDSFGFYSWKEAYARGDRLVKVEVSGLC